MHSKAFVRLSKYLGALPIPQHPTSWRPFAGKIVKGKRVEGGTARRQQWRAVAVVPQPELLHVHEMAKQENGQQLSRKDRYCSDNAPVTDATQLYMVFQVL